MGSQQEARTLDGGTNFESQAAVKILINQSIEAYAEGRIASPTLLRQNPGAPPNESPCRPPSHPMHLLAGSIDLVESVDVLLVSSTQDCVLQK